MRSLPGLLSALLLVLTLAACGGSPQPGAPADRSGPIAVVASTDVYGDIVHAVGGDLVQVTSIIDDPGQDPHQFEADAQNQLALSKAELVVENGGGYDDFIDSMIQGASVSAPVLNVTEISGYPTEPAKGEFNEHLWYDFATMAKFTDRLAAELSGLRPDGASTFRANAKTFRDQLDVLGSQESEIKAHHSGVGVAITEPVPLYLLSASGLVDKTPAAFSEAVENDTDVPPAVLSASVELFDRHQVALLVYNVQTAGPQTEAVRAAAQRNGIPTVGVTETLPAGQTYLTWMGANIAAVSRALHS